jgi:hypothetical protein
MRFDDLGSQSGKLARLDRWLFDGACWLVNLHKQLA